MLDHLPPAMAAGLGGGAGPGGTGSGAEVQDLGSGLDPDIVDTTKNGGSDCARELRKELTREC